MPQTRISVRLSRPDQDDLREHAEHASALPDLMTSVGLDVGRQAVIRRGVDTFALYTLTDAGADVSTDTVRMGRDGRVGSTAPRSSGSGHAWTALPSIPRPPRKRPVVARSCWSCSTTAIAED